MFNKPNTNRSTWDAIVIGSGIGGMTAAAYLAAGGTRTLVLEAYKLIGGSTHVFRRQNQWEFDVGVHYLGDCGPHGLVPSMLRGVGLDKDKVTFLPLDPDGFDTIVFPDRQLKVPKGWAQYQQNLIATFPQEAEQIRKVVGVLEKIGSNIDRSRTPASLGALAKFVVSTRTASMWALVPLTKFLDAHRLSPGLKAALAVQYVTYASPPHRTPLAVHAIMLHNFLHDGAWFPQGGGQVLSARLGEVVVANGGDIFTNAPVRKILIENGRVQGVELDDGSQMAAPVVVSNADIKQTYLELVGHQHLRRRTVKRVEGFRMSQPFFNCYLGVDIDLSRHMANTNFYSIPTAEDVTTLYHDLIDNRHGYSPQAWLEQCRLRTPAYVSVTSTKDRNNFRAAPAGCSVLEVMTLCPADPSFWGLKEWPKPGDDTYRENRRYREVKEAFTEIMIQRAADVLPGIDKHILWREAATPITHHRYTRSTNGTPYGIELTHSQFAPFRPGVRTEIEGLYLCGASMAWGPAVEGAMLSGMHAAGAVLGRDLDREIRGGAVLGQPLPTDGVDGWDPLKAALKLSEGPGWRRQRMARADITQGGDVTESGRL